MTFPTVSGSNLLRQKLTLPQDFQGRLNLVFIPFERWHQMEVDSWSALAEELEEKYAGLVYYELPTLQNGGAIYKIFLNEGMRAGIPNPKTRERTITLYLDKADFRAALDMTDEEHIYVLVVDRRGKSSSALAARIAARERQPCVRHFPGSFPKGSHDMSAKKWLMLFINLLGGGGVIGSYIWGFLTHPNAGQALWGGVPDSIRPFYTAGMFLAATGYFAFTYFILFRLNPDETRVFSRFPSGCSTFSMQPS